MILAQGSELRLIEPEPAAGSPAPSSLLADVIRAHVLRVLKSTGYRIYGPNGAAAMLGAKPTTLYSMLKRLGISRQRAHRVRDAHVVS